MSKQPTQSSQALLPRWANDQDGWLRRIVSDVLKNRTQAPDLDIDRYLKILLSEKKLSQEAFQTVPKLEEKQVDQSALEPVRIEFLKIGEGINAIKQGQEIEFAPDVTVIFGENGSGKSGFVRVLKRASGVRTAEDILHNVREDKRPIPSADFRVTVGTKTQPIKWQNEFGITPLNRVSVFDARGARLHVEDDLTYIYTPGELTLFPLVQNAIERVKAALETTITNRMPGANTMLGSFDRACSIYPIIETLGAATDLTEIRQFATLPENSDSAIESLKIEVDALRSTNSSTELKRARDRASIVRELKIAVETTKSFDIPTYDSHLNSRATAAHKREEAGSKAFEGFGIANVLSQEWRAFVQAGENYIRRSMRETYPLTGDSCGYCQQPLADSALALIRKYRDFCNNQITSALEAANQNLRNYSAPLIGLNVEALLQRLNAEISSAPDPLTIAAPLLGEIGRLRSRVSSEEAGITWPQKGEAIDKVEAVLSGEESRLDALIKSLEKSIEERQEALAKKQKDLIELQGRKTTNGLLPQIEKRVSDAKWVGRATIVKTNFSGVLRSLTEAAKEASEELLNRDFEIRFAQECRRLRAPNVTLNFPGRQGQVTRRKLVASYKPTQILSEGEQKALAIADFLAEVDSVPASSPVIFDDPITSLDYRRIHEVCDRIVSLSVEHQIIVFTHNIWFAAELLSKAEKKKWKYYDIRLDGNNAGIVSSASHPRVDTTAQVSESVRKLIESAETQQDGEVKSALVERGYEKLRALCEVIVEQEMFKGVIQRYAPNAMMTKLEKINVAKLPDSIKGIGSVFEKCCRYIASHSQPIETQGIRPTLSELKADYRVVLDARQPHKE